MIAPKCFSRARSLYFRDENTMPACYRRWLTSIVLTLAIPAVCRADDVTKDVTENGVTYHETHQTVLQPVVETHNEARQQVVYVDQCKTEMQTVQQAYQTPVTEYVWEAFWANRWNPFEQPYIAYRYVPRVRWDLHTQTVQVPVTSHQWVAQTQTIQVPVTTQRMIAGEVIYKMPVSYKPADPFANGNSAMARSLTPSPSPDGTISR
jgi:hypothetical protein